VSTKDGLDWELVEETVLDHFASPSPALLGGLKDKHDPAIEVSMIGQVLGRCEQHRRMPIMTTGMHAPGVLTGVREGVVLGHGQRIDVGPQSQASLAAPPLDHAHNPRLGQTSVHFNAPFGQALGDQIGGSDLLEAQLGMSVKIPPKSGHRGGIVYDGFDQRHHGSDLL
jgi:hypothetical protein